MKVATWKKWSEEAKSIEANEVHYTLIKVIFSLPSRPGQKHFQIFIVLQGRLCGAFFFARQLWSKPKNV